MKDTTGAQVLGRTRWRRFAVVMVPTVAAAGALTVLLANGAVAASFGISGQQFKVSATSLDGDGFAQYGDVDTTHNGSVPVAISGISSAEITSLCQSVVTTMPVVGTVTLTLKAPTAHATNLMIDLSQLNGNATFSNVNIGQDASTLSDGGPAAHGQAGTFGQQATHIKITNLQQTAYATTAGTFQLNGLHMAMSTGDHGCF